MLVVLLSCFGVKAQETISFLESFNLEPTLLNGMVIAKIPDALQAKRIIGNPAVAEDKDVIGWMSLDREEDHSDDAGAIASAFASEEALKNILGN